ncbi:MAG TPA: hypothetical protein VJQ49_02230 [Casimicrobiaceae bacterium]|nr:hypothetical protein [Casimicrobiaceae bacterium]
MNHAERIRLMHAVLDGEATPDEARDLDREIAADPSAGREFSELERLFAGLRRMPRPFPPEGLVAAVLAAVPQRPDAADSPGSQLLARRGVLRQIWSRPRGTIPGQTGGVHKVSQPGPQPRGETMNQQQSGFRKRAFWVGGGIAAVAAILAVSYGLDFPPRNDDTVGTIVPAQRYRAPQMSGDDIKLGSPSGGQAGASASGQVGGQSLDGRSADGRSVDGHAVDGRSVDGRSVDGRSVDGRSVDGRSVDGRSVDGRSVDGRSVDGRSVDGRSVDGRSVDGRSVDGRSVDGRSVDGRSVDGRSVDGRSVDGRSVDGRSVDGRSVDGRSVDGRSVDGRSTN